MSAVRAHRRHMLRGHHISDKRLRTEEYIIYRYLKNIIVKMANASERLNLEANIHKTNFTRKI